MYIAKQLADLPSSNLIDSDTTQTEAISAWLDFNFSTESPYSINSTSCQHFFFFTILSNFVYKQTASWSSLNLNSIWNSKFRVTANFSG